MDKIYHFLFNSKHFPLHFSVQSIATCISLRKISKKQPWWKSLMLGSLTTLVGRVLIAYVTERPNPLFENPFLLPTFFFIWFLVNASPFDLICRFICFPPVIFVVECLYAIVQVRQIIHGISIAEKAFVNSVTGIISVSLILSSSESFIWIFTGRESRDFSVPVIMKNIILTCSYYYFLKNPVTIGHVVFEKTQLSFCMLFIRLIEVIINDIVFGIDSTKSIDLVLYHFFGKFVPYYGDRRKTK